MLPVVVFLLGVVVGGCFPGCVVLDGGVTKACRPLRRRLEPLVIVCFVGIG